MTASAMPAATTGEVSDTFDCFGSLCGAWVAGDTPSRTAQEAVETVRRVLLRWHREFSRFEPDSQLCALNRDPRVTVPVASLMARFAAAAVDAARLTQGLVDATLLGDIERAGYTTHHQHELSVPLERALALTPARAPARAHPARRWETISVTLEGVPSVTRPPGVKLDSGGIAKGLFADVLGDLLASHASYAVDCGGDLRLGGADGTARPVHVTGPFNDAILHSFELAEGGVATSGIARRSWLDADGRVAHHLLDPSTGRPVYSGIVQVTALAPSAVEAEVRAKAALLSGPDAAPGWLPHGGVVVFDDASYVLF
jgi:FAD:protein FMN transferase